MREPRIIITLSPTHTYAQTLAYLLPAMTMAFRRAEQIYKTRSEGWSVQVRAPPGRERQPLCCAANKEVAALVLRHTGQLPSACDHSPQRAAQTS